MENSPCSDSENPWGLRCITTAANADTESPSHRAAEKVIPLIKQWGKQYLLGITLSGAYTHNTAVSLSSDVDVLIALNPVPNMEMKAIFWGSSSI
jgi:hypothetical protein